MNYIITIIVIIIIIISNFDLDTFGFFYLFIYFLFFNAVDMLNERITKFFCLLAFISWFCGCLVFLAQLTAGKIHHLSLDPRPQFSDVVQSLFPLPLRSAYPKPLHLNWFLRLGWGWTKRLVW